MRNLIFGHFSLHRLRHRHRVIEVVGILGENAVLSILFERCGHVVGCTPSREEMVETFITFQTEAFSYSGRVTINIGL